MASTLAMQAELREMLGDLIEWDAYMGCHEDSRWEKARELYERSRDKSAALVEGIQAAELILAAGRIEQEAIFLHYALPAARALIGDT